MSLSLQSVHVENEGSRASDVLLLLLTPLRSQLPCKVVLFVFLRFYFCPPVCAPLLKCYCKLFSHNIETTDMSQRRLCHCCRGNLEFYSEGQAVVFAKTWGKTTRAATAETETNKNKNQIKLHVCEMCLKKTTQTSSVTLFTLPATLFTWASRVTGGRPARILIVCRQFQCCGLSPSVSLCLPVCV